MTVEPGEPAAWTRLQVVRFHRVFLYEKLGGLNAFLAFADRVFARLFHIHYHFLTEDRELCGWRLQDGEGRLVFEIPDATGGVPLSLRRDYSEEEED